MRGARGQDGTRSALTRRERRRSLCGSTWTPWQPALTFQGLDLGPMILPMGRHANRIRLNGAKTLREVLGPAGRSSESLVLTFRAPPPSAAPFRRSTPRRSSRRGTTRCTIWCTSARRTWRPRCRCERTDDGSRRTPRWVGAHSHRAVFGVHRRLRRDTTSPSLTLVCFHACCRR